MSDTEFSKVFEIYTKKWFVCENHVYAAFGDVYRCLTCRKVFVPKTV
jgi:hypothetical protein